MKAGGNPQSPLYSQLNRRLETWKEIAAYLGRDVRTVQRWEESEGLPVKRHQHRRQGSVFATTADLDAWIAGRTTEKGAQLVSLPIADETAVPNARSRQVWLMAAVLATGLAVAAWFFSTRHRTGAQVHTIAVLPFVDMSAQHHLEHIADGLTDQTIDALSTSGGLRVVARTSVFAYKNKARDVREIAHELGVDSVMEGSVREINGKLRISAELNRGADGLRIWSQSWERLETDLSGAENQIAAGAAQALNVRYESRKLAGFSIQPKAFDAYLDGRYEFNQPDPAAMHRAERKFRQAISLQPNYAPFWAALSDVLFHEVDNGGSDPREVMPMAKEAALNGVALDATCGEAHMALGIVRLHYDWDWKGAAGEFERAMELLPGSGYVRHWHAHLVTVEGKLPEAIGEMKTALALDPLSPILNEDLVMLYHSAGRLDLAIAQMRRVVELTGHAAGGQAALAAMLQEAGDSNGARQAASLALQKAPDDPDVRAALAMYHAFAGDTVEARAAVRMLETSQSETHLDPVPLAMIHHALGEDNIAMDWLETAYKQRWPEIIYLAAMPHLPSCNPRFRLLLRKMQLAQPKSLEHQDGC